MDNFNPNSLPDDPYRVAPPGCAPGDVEIEPPELPQVNEAEAERRVIDVLSKKQEHAFGDTASIWEEVLLDDVLSMLDRLFIALLQNEQATLDLVGNYLRECVYDHANNNLAEMDNDQLEAEGLLR